MRTRVARLSGLSVLSLALACVGSVEEPAAGERPAVPGAPAPGPPAATPSTPTSAPRGGETAPAERPGPAGGAAAGAPASACTPAPARIWKLTPAQIERTVAALLPGVAVPAAGLRDSLATGSGFSNAAHWRDMSEPHVTQLLALATALADQVAARGAAVEPCLGQKPAAPACVRQLVTGFGARAYRRPLEAAEIDDLVQLHEADQRANGPDLALRQVLRALFLSPSFLYRSEVGPPGARGTVTLTAHERAAALSYFLTDGPPDAPLMEAAAQGALSTSAGLAAQARRLLAAPAGAGGVLQMYDELLRTAQVLDRSKDPKLFPRWSAQVAADMAAETRALVEQVLWRDGAKLSVLLTTNVTFLNERLAAVYGVPGVSGDRLRAVTLPAGRQGVLMQGSFLATEATMTDTDVVRRGLRVMQDWLCQPIPEPPPEAGALPAAGPEKLTHRERLARHTADPRCSGCHALIDPAGLALETFDAVGRARTTEGGKPIDPTGVLRTPSGEVRFADAVELATALSRSDDVADCTVRRVFTYAMGRAPEAGDACTLARLRAGMKASGGDLGQLIIGLVEDEAFVTRTR
jgi:hypothetical protein